MIEASRGYVEHDGRQVKFLSASIFRNPWTADSREFVFRLPEDDPRPCRHMSGADWLFDWYDGIPVGVWAEIAYPA